MQLIDTQQDKLAKELSHVWVVTSIYNITPDGTSSNVEIEIFAHYNDAKQLFSMLIPKEPYFSRSEEIRKSLYPTTLKYSPEDYLAMEYYDYYQYDDYNEPMVGATLILNKKRIRAFPMEVE